jgi:hypothetical protein
MHRPAIFGIAAVLALAVGYSLTAQDKPAAKAGAAGGSCCPSEKTMLTAGPAAAEGAACPFSGDKAATAAVEKCGDGCDTLLASMDATLKQIESAKASNDSKQMGAALEAAGKQLTAAKEQIGACLAAKGGLKETSAPKAEGAACCPTEKTTAAK